MAVRIDGLKMDMFKDDSTSRLPPEEELLCAFEEVLVPFISLSLSFVLPRLSLIFLKTLDSKNNSYEGLK